MQCKCEQMNRKSNLIYSHRSRKKEKKEEEGEDATPFSHSYCVPMIINIIRMLFYLFLLLTGTCDAQSPMLVRLGIIDDHDYPQRILNIDIPNTTFCEQHGIQLQIFWINSSHSVSDLVESMETRDNVTHIYLARAAKFSTNLIQDFCQTHRIPFITMRSLTNQIMSVVRVRRLFQSTNLDFFLSLVSFWESM